MRVYDIITTIESFAPLALQESYDNCGLLLGSEQQEISSVLLTIDVTESVVDEAIALGTNMIIAHHPLIFTGLKKINGKNDVERSVIKAIQNNIAVYVAHTNIDSVKRGVNAKICEKLGVVNTRMMYISESTLTKIVCFVPHSHARQVQQAMFDAGAGSFGNYDSCSFSVEGIGSFRALEGASPYIGKLGETHTESEVRLEVLCAPHLVSKVCKAMQQAHPYEEPAYDMIPLSNTNAEVGSGMIGELLESISVEELFTRIKKIFGVPCIRYAGIQEQQIKKIAVCGGSGSFLISHAMRAGADILITADVKYHDFFLAENKMVIADIGHYESEQYTKEIFYEILNKKFANFALHFSKVNTNPINYI